MASFAGLISGVLGGAAAGYGEGAQMEMKKQADLDLRKQMLEAETEKASRLDEIKRGRDVKGRLDEEARVQSPEYLAAQARAKAGAFTADVAAGVPEARAASEVATGTAAAGVETTLAPVKAAAASATTLANAEASAAVAPAVARAFTEQYKASKEFEHLKASDATAEQINKAKTLAADKDYMDALAKIDLVTHANIIRAAEIRAASVESTSADRLEAARFRAANKGPGSTVPTTADLQRQITAAENSLANKLGVKKTDLNEELARLQKRTDPASKTRFEGLASERAALDAARKQLLEWSKKPKDDAAPAAAASASGVRPSLDSFRK